MAWSGAYCGRTIIEAIKNNWTDRNYITANAFSPAFLFRLLEPNDAVCKGGANVEDAFSLMKNRGAIPFSALPVQCVSNLTAEQLSLAANAKIKDFVRLFDIGAAENLKVQSVKKSIAEKNPVVIAIRVAPSFQTARNCWLPVETPAANMGGHAMCVVGFDDNMYGGAFEIQNSWGQTWGNMGYIWIRYADFANFVKYAFEFVDPPIIAPNVTDLSGEIKLALAGNTEMPANLLVSTRGLKVVSANKTAQPLTIYKTNGAYTAGTNFRIYLSNDQPAYVYAISSDLSNEITRIFPYEDGISAALSYKKNAVAIPDEDHFIQFDDKPGTDFLCVLYSKNELNINQLIKQVSTQTGTFNEKVFKALGDRLVAPADINFSTDKIAFKGISKGKEVIAMMVELDHK
ncbi:C1 family peptidase [Mucilaginibacter antarcticus]|uniref:C1 family peptidase n=1 Tax=Mucilaginibacter antarcticus TaxID=1855725 RepID=UPI003637C665